MTDRAEGKKAKAPASTSKSSAAKKQTPKAKASGPSPAAGQKRAREDEADEPEEKVAPLSVVAKTPAQAGGRVLPSSMVCVHVPMCVKGLQAWGHGYQSLTTQAVWILGMVGVHVCVEVCMCAWKCACV